MVTSPAILASNTAPAPARRAGRSRALGGAGRAALAAIGLAITITIAGCGGGGGGDGVADTTPVATRSVAGATQTATVDASVPVAPAMQVLDRAGRPVAGLPVTFVVVSGNGTVTGASTVTGADGIARAGGWRLGPQAGLQRLAARSPGLPEVVFEATASAPPGLNALFAVTSTDGQSATAGTALAIDPAAVLRTPGSQPVAGAMVTWSVTGGGGTVQNAMTLTDANGVATPGRWTLGTTPGAQSLRASAPGATPVTLTATAMAAGAPTLTRSVFVSGLANPWDAAFAPDGTMLYTERGRGLSVRLSDGTTRLLFRPADFVAQDQSGMLGVALDPQFATNRRVYVFMASNAGGATDNRIVRFVVDAGWTTASQRTDIVTGIAYAGGAHSGGRIRFGPDGLLYVTTGDNRRGEVPQSPVLLGGKVLRVTADGAAAPGNGARPGFDTRILTFGHRNVQGIAFRPGTGEAFVSEHGPGNNDEVTRLAPGGNAGWDPLCRPAGSGYCGYSQPIPMTDTTRFPDALRPAWTTGSSSLGMSGSTFVDGAAWRDWNGALVVALLSGRRLEVLRVAANALSATSLAQLAWDGERLRTAVQGPDGALYVLTDGRAGGDQIWRIAPN